MEGREWCPKDPSMADRKCKRKSTSAWAGVVKAPQGLRIERYAIMCPLGNTRQRSRNQVQSRGRRGSATPAILARRVMGQADGTAGNIRDGVTQRQGCGDERQTRPCRENEQQGRDHESRRREGGCSSRKSKVQEGDRWEEGPYLCCSARGDVGMGQ